jgi:hypothetical protein
MPFATYPNIITPSDDTVLWRYIAFNRLQQYLKNEQLWFARLDEFDDPLEGTLTDGEIWFDPPTDGHPLQLRDATADPIAQMMRHTAYVQCWCMGAESMAMWDLYGKTQDSVAVTTTVGQLKHQLSKDTRSVYMAEVEYVDWSESRILKGVFDPVLRKVQGYEHESEMRLFFWNVAGITADGIYHPDQTPQGLTFSVNPKEMIDAIWIGPRDAARTQSMVEALIAQYKLDVPIRVSSKMSTKRSMTYPIQPRDI